MANLCTKVIVLSSPYRAICEELSCEITKFEVESEEDYDYFAEYEIHEIKFKGKCQDNQELHICPPKKTLLTNAFGEGKEPFTN